LKTRFRSPEEVKNFSSNLFVQTGSGAHPASYPLDTVSPFPGGKAPPGRDADYSLQYNAEVKNEKDLYLLRSLAPAYRVTGQLYQEHI
jgi:hypothetical protein